MYLDSQLQFSDNQGLTGSAVADNDIDLGIDQNIGQGEPMAAVIIATVAADFTTGDETYQIDLLTDNDIAFSSATSIGAVFSLGSALGIGEKVVIPIGHFTERYLRLSYVLGGTTPTVVFDAYLMPLSMVDGVTDYANGYNIT